MPVLSVSAIGDLLYTYDSRKYAIYYNIHNSTKRVDRTGNVFKIAHI